MLDLLKTNKAAAASTANGAEPVSRETPAGGIVWVPLRKVLDNPYQYRGHYDPEHILNLAASIKSLKTELPATRGLQQIPLARVVKVRDDGGTEIHGRHDYQDGAAALALKLRPQHAVQLMFGHSRLRAWMVIQTGLQSSLSDNGAALGLDLGGVSEIDTRYADLLEPDPDYGEFPVTLGFAMDHAMWVHATTENSQRKNVNAIDEARSLQRAMDEFGLKTEEAGKPFGYARSTTANKLRLLTLPADVQAKIAGGELSERHGRELLRVVVDPAVVEECAAYAILRGESVRQLAERVKWEEKKLVQRQRRQAELAAARAALAAGWTLPTGECCDPSLVSEMESHKVSEFDSKNGTDARLITDGVCGPHCACFCFAYSEWRHQDGYRPDPDLAPHVCAACSDFDAYRVNRETLKDANGGDKAAREAERKQRIAELDAAADAVWQRWLADLDRYALWNSIALWQVVDSKMMHWHLSRIIQESDSVAAMLDRLLHTLYERTSIFYSDLSANAGSVDAVQKLIDQLSGVSRETDEYDGIEQI